MAGNAKNSSRAVEFGLCFAPSRADDLTYWTDAENLAQGDEILLEQIKLRKVEKFSPHDRTKEILSSHYEGTYITVTKYP